MSERNVFFRVSSGLKNILGKDLITNDFVAVFELVKNSFDAHASNVWLVYRNDKLFVVDDGKGMSEEDILNKWLFVAYSAKEDGTEDQDISQDYRDELASKRYFAGNKGVGRFSCDRLGSQLKLQSKTKSEEAVHLLKVEWDDFEKSLSEEFIDIPAKLDDLEDYDLPMEIRELRQGTILEISNLRESWDRQKLITLRRHLEKLINPFELTTSSFRVHVICDREQAEDNKIKSSTDTDADNLELEEYAAPVTVNGEVKNLIFAELTSKTTHIKVNFDKSNSDLVTTLIDRSEEVYVTRESHNFSTLVDTDFSCSLFYLNRAAKTIFAKRMGISSVNFGSIFLFKNNFRIFPTGETGDDTFGIDRRKSQGYARYLGTRDLVGRIDIRGNGKEFKESTSRDQGLVKNNAFRQLEDCFFRFCFRRLESYVVGVSWPDKPDKDRDNIAGLLSDSGKARVVDFLQRLSGNDEIQLVRYSEKLVSLVNERSESFEKVVDGLKNIANDTSNTDLLLQVEKAQVRYLALKQSEAVARDQAERERADRLAAEVLAEKEREARLVITKQRDRLEVEITEEKKRNLFLTASTTLDHDTVVNLHHQIVIYSTEIQAVLELMTSLIKADAPLSKDDIATYIDALGFHNSKVLAVSKLATKANFRVEADMLTADIAQYIEDYVSQVASLYAAANLQVEKTSGVELVREFRPIEISMLIDNLISNADRANASTIIFQLSRGEKGSLAVRVEDNGSGLKQRAIDDPQRIFEKGFSTTLGSGLGLFHVRQIMEHLNGFINVDVDVNNGFALNLNFPKIK